MLCFECFVTTLQGWSLTWTSDSLTWRTKRPRIPKERNTPCLSVTRCWSMRCVGGSTRQFPVRSCRNSNSYNIHSISWLLVRAFAHGVMGHRIDHSWWTWWMFIFFQLVIHNWCNWYNKGCGMCYPGCGMVHIKEPLLLIGKTRSCSGASGFFSYYLNVRLQYVQHNIT